MKYLKLYEQFRIILEELDDEELVKPSKQILLDGTSSSGKSAALKGLSNDWCVLAVDSFYNLLNEEAVMQTSVIKINQNYLKFIQDVLIKLLQELMILNWLLDGLWLKKLSLVR